MAPSDPIFPDDKHEAMKPGQGGDLSTDLSATPQLPQAENTARQEQSLALELMGRVFHIQCDANSRDRITALAARLNLRFQTMRPLSADSQMSAHDDPFAQMAFIALQLENDLDAARHEVDILRHACETALARIGILSAKLDEMSQ